MEIVGYFLVAGWMLGVFLAGAGLVIFFISRPLTNLLRRVFMGEAQSKAARPGMAAVILKWTGRAFGLACFAAGTAMFVYFEPHVGAPWDASRPRFNSRPGDTALCEAVVNAVKPLAVDGKVMGLAVGVIDGDVQAVYGFGRKSALDAASPDGNSEFEIGSVTKVFTSLLLASLAEEGKVRLDEPLQEVMGDTVKVPTFNDTPIRLVDLSTHTAGLPRVPGALMTLSTNWAAMTAGNPYGHFPVESWRAALGSCILSSEPGTRCEYSNFGAVVLGDALCRATGKSYQELLQTRITQVLGMKDTAVTLSAEQNARRVPGYAALFDVFSTRLSFPANPWDFPPGTEGVGSLKSTVNDMLLFLAANLEPPSTPLGRAMEEAQRPRRDMDAPALRMGLGWVVQQSEDAADPIVWHNGGTGGYSSFVGFRRNRKVAVVLLSNSAGTAGRLDLAGFGILDAVGNN